MYKRKALWYTFFGQKKDKYKKKKHPIKVSFISIHFFFLWIYGISDTVIMGFVHLIYNTTTQSNAVLKERKKKNKVSPRLHTTATALTPEFSN